MTIATAYKPIYGPEAHTPAWFEARKISVGASDSAKAAGLSENGTPLGMYQLMTGEIDPDPENDAMIEGRCLESSILDIYEHKTGEVLRRGFPMLFHPVNRFVAATLDAMHVSDGTPVDAKSTTWRMSEHFGEEYSDDMPIDYVCQGQQQCYVANSEKCIFYVMFDSRTYKTYIVHRNEMLIEALVDAARELVERVKNLDPPPADYEHRSTLRLLRQRNYERSKAVEIDSNTIALWNKIEARSRKIKRLEERNKADKARIVDALGDAERGISPEGEELYRRTIEATRWAESDIAEAQKKVGQIKRKSHTKVFKRRGKA